MSVYVARVIIGCIMHFVGHVSIRLKLKLYFFIHYILFITYLHRRCFCSLSGSNRDFHLWELFYFYCSIITVIYLWRMVRNHGIS
jgi:hypothetical protein